MQNRRSPAARRALKKRYPPQEDDDEQQEPASPHRAGHYAGLHAEDTPRTTANDVQQHLALIPKQAYSSQKLTPRSVLRYQAHWRLYREQPIPSPCPMACCTGKGNDQIYVHHGPAPVPRIPAHEPRRSAPPPRQQRPAARDRATTPPHSRADHPGVSTGSGS